MKYTLLALALISNPVNLGPTVPDPGPQKPIALCEGCVIVHYQYIGDEE